MPGTQDVADTFAEVARSLAEQEGLHPTLQRIVELAVESVPSADHAAVSLVRARRRVETVASTGDLPQQVDAVQYETAQGPCLDAIWDQDVVRVDDTSDTERWPDFAARACELGVLSMLSFRLFVEGDTAGAINLYSSERKAFDDDDERVGHVFAAHAALAWDHEKEVDGLRTAVATRTLIGQATGVVMATRKVGAEEAFALLRTSSQHRNVKLRDVAQEVVDTGALP